MYDKIDSSADQIYNEFRARELVPIYKCPGINAAGAGYRGSEVNTEDVMVHSGDDGEGPLKRFTFSYTLCSNVSKYRCGQGDASVPCCPYHSDIYKDVIVNHEQLGTEYVAACKAVDVTKSDFFQLHGSVRDVWIQWEAQNSFTAIEQDRVDAPPKLPGLMRAPPPPPRSMSAAEQAAILKRKLFIAKVTSRSEQSRQKKQLQRGDIPTGEVQSGEAGGQSVDPKPSSAQVGPQTGAGNQSTAAPATPEGAHPGPANQSATPPQDPQHGAGDQSGMPSTSGASGSNIATNTGERPNKKGKRPARNEVEKLLS